MTSRADSLTHDDLQKAEITRLRAARAEALKCIYELKAALRVNALVNNPYLTHKEFDDWWKTTGAAQWLEKNP